jgi:excisionase family DNA binding protein
MGIGEAAKLLRVSVVTLRRWCDRGEIPFWRTPSGQRRFDREQLEAWLEQRRHD